MLPVDLPCVKARGDGPPCADDDEPPRVEETPSWACGWVYAFVTPVGYVKLGFSTCPERRLRENTQLPFPVVMGHVFPVASRNVETRLHHFFAPAHVRGEWFALDTEAVELVKGIREARSTQSLPSLIQQRAVYPHGRVIVPKVEAYSGPVVTLGSYEPMPCPRCQQPSIFLTAGARSIWFCTACPFTQSCPLSGDNRRVA